MKVVLQTSRALLREFTMDDAPDVYDLDSDPEVLRYVHAEPASLQSTQSTFLPQQLAGYRQHPGYGFWAALAKRTNEFLGWFHFRPYLGNLKDGELGFRLKRSFWGRGYATEVGRALIEYGFDTLHVSSVVAVALPENAASIRVMEKVGLKYGSRYLHECGLEVVRYRLSKSEFDENRKAP